MYVISFCNQKGGTGKTSVTSNTAAFLSNAEKDKRILLIDLDAQGHTTYLMYKDPDDLEEEETILMLFQDKEYKNKGIIHQTRFKNVEIVPSNFLLTGAKVRINELKDRLWRVWRYLKLFNRFYDYVLIDTPPDLDIFLMNALYASDYTIIPTDLETLAIRGINDLLNTIENVQSKKRDRVGEDLRIMGVLPNKLNKRYTTHKNVMELSNNASDRLSISNPGIYVPFEQIRELYLEKDWLCGLAIFPCSKHYEKKELTKFFEYMMYGIPVVCSDFHAWRDLIEGNEVGIVVDPGNINKAIESIEWLRKNPEKRKIMGENGKKLVKEYYNWAKEEAKLLDLYRSLVN